MSKSFYGTLRVSKPVQTFKNSTFKKQEFIIQSSETGNCLKFEFRNDNINKLQSMLLGMNVAVEYYPTGNEYEVKKDNKPTGEKDFIVSLVATSIKQI